MDPIAYSRPDRTFKAVSKTTRWQPSVVGADADCYRRLLRLRDTMCQMELDSVLADRRCVQPRHGRIHANSNERIWTE